MNKKTFIIGLVVIAITVGLTVIKSRNTPNEELPIGERVYEMSEVRKHDTATSCWSVIDNNVYDLTAWIVTHPGGMEAILGLCGIDGSVAFNGVHGGSEPQLEALATMKIGTLEEKKFYEIFSR